MMLRMTQTFFRNQSLCIFRTFDDLRPGDACMYPDEREWPVVLRNIAKPDFDRLMPKGGRKKLARGDMVIVLVLDTVILGAEWLGAYGQLRQGKTVHNLTLLTQDMAARWVVNQSNDCLVTSEGV